MLISDITNKNSTAKSLSDTLSSALAVGLENSNNFDVKFLSIGNDVPAKAPEPRGLSVYYTHLTLPTTPYV